MDWYLKRNNNTDWIIHIYYRKFQGSNCKEKIYLSPSNTRSVITISFIAESSPFTTNINHSNQINKILRKFTFIHLFDLFTPIRNWESIYHRLSLIYRQNKFKTIKFQDILLWPLLGIDLFPLLLDKVFHLWAFQFWIQTKLSILPVPDNKSTFRTHHVTRSIIFHKMSIWMAWTCQFWTTPITSSKNKRIL